MSDTTPSRVETRRKERKKILIHLMIITSATLLLSALAVMDVLDRYSWAEIKAREADARIFGEVVKLVLFSWFAWEMFHPRRREKLVAKALKQSPKG